MRFRDLFGLAVFAVAVAGPSLDAQSTSVVSDDQRPARLEPVRYPTGGVQVPARLFVAAGVGLHPTILLLHGFPGTELNLDLARVLQRAGWNVLAIHYRGVWGAPGRFSFSHTVEDAHAALAWLRSPAAAAIGVDQARIVVLGHSMGGFDTAMLGDDPRVAGFVLISPADMGRVAQAGAASAGFADDASYTNASVGELVEDARAHTGTWDWPSRAARMAGRPVLILTSDDGLAATGEAAAAAVRAAGEPAPTLVHMATDHSYDDRRIELAAAVTRWLGENFPTR